MTTDAVSPLTIAVLGAGIVGRTLATSWAKVGHTVVLGSREPASPKTSKAVDEVRDAAGTSTVSAALHESAVDGADAVVITVPGNQVADLVESIRSALDAKTVIDATNNTGSDGSLNSVDLLVQSGAVVHRAFNTVGWEQMRQPMFGGLRAAMPYTGPAVDHNDVVERLIADIGFEPVWLGNSPAAIAAVDAMARLWFLLAFERGYGRRVAWRLLTERDDPAEQD